MNLVVLSACYEKAELSSTLRESCEIAKLPLAFCQARAFDGVWRGDMRTGKMVAALEALPEIKSHACTHVLWADAFDCFVSPKANFATILQRWFQLGCRPMVFSGEKNCWPDAHKAELYPPSNSPWRSLNAGTWLAQIDYLEDSLRAVLARYPDEQDDQRMWTDALVVDRILPGAIVDTERLIFQTMWGTDISEVGDPCVVHYNGGIWRNPEDRRFIEHWESVRNAG